MLCTLSGSALQAGTDTIRDRLHSVYYSWPSHALYTLSGSALQAGTDTIRDRHWPPFDGAAAVTRHRPKTTLILHQQSDPAASYSQSQATEEITALGHVRGFRC